MHLSFFHTTQSWRNKGSHLPSVCIQRAIISRMELLGRPKIFIKHQQALLLTAPKMDYCLLFQNALHGTEENWNNHVKDISCCLISCPVLIWNRGLLFSLFKISVPFLLWNDTRFLYSCASLWYVFGGGTQLTVTGKSIIWSLIFPPECVIFIFPSFIPSSPTLTPCDLILRLLLIHQGWCFSLRTEHWDQVRTC